MKLKEFIFNCTMIIMIWQLILYQIMQRSLMMYNNIKPSSMHYNITIVLLIITIIAFVNAAKSADIDDKK